MRVCETTSREGGLDENFASSPYSSLVHLITEKLFVFFHQLRDETLVLAV